MKRGFYIALALILLALFGVVVFNQNGAKAPAYTHYTPENFAATAHMKRIYFFKASWCPICQAADTHFTNNPTAIPEGVVIYKIDFDTEQELKKQHQVLYPHTFVQVDENGSYVASWNGDNVALLEQNVR